MRKLLKEIDEALNHKNFIKAKTLTHSGAASSPEKVDWKIYQALIQIKNNQLDLAIIFLQNALKNVTQVEILYVQLGQLHQKKNNPHAALAVFHQGLRQFPLSTQLLTQYIQCAQALGLTQSNILQQRAGLLLSLIEFNQLDILSSCYEILLPTADEIGAIWLHDQQIQGWIIDPAETEKSLSMLAFSPKKKIEFIADQATPVLKKLGIGHGFNGFSLTIKEYVDQIDVVSKQKRTRLFGSPLFTYCEHKKLANPYPFKKTNTLDLQAPDTIINIIIPVFNDLSTLKQCLNAISNADNFKTYMHLIIVNDCSASALIKPYLHPLENSPQFTIIHNAYNMGFIATVNIGMQQHPWRDVVLLNSDTRVVNNWLDRLQQLAYCDKKVATVTPISNNAEKFSYPTPLESNDLPDIETIKIFDKIAAKVNQFHALEVPTGNGFCFFIKRECLSQIGYFNQTDLLRGYSEESEFCLRASEKGWTHLCATNVYVGHQGGQSFKQERARLVYLNNERIKQKYPLYLESVSRFIINDPLKKARKRIERSCLNQMRCDELYIVDYHIKSHPVFKNQLASKVLADKSVWMLSIAYKSMQTQFQLHAVAQGHTNLEYHCLTDFNQLVDDLKKLEATVINVHHSRYFPKSLTKVLTQLARPLNVCPYDRALDQQFSELLWTNSIHSLQLLSDYAASQYQDYPKNNKISLPEYFYNTLHKTSYLPYIAIFSDITNQEQKRLLYAIVHDWQLNNLPLTFIIIGNSNFKYALESSQKIIFTPLKIEQSLELKKLCTHVFVLPNSSDFISADLALALQYGFQLIALSQPHTQEILSSQSTAITIKFSNNPLEMIKKTFHHYYQKIKLNNDSII